MTFLHLRTLPFSTGHATGVLVISVTVSYTTGKHGIKMITQNETEHAHRQGVPTVIYSYDW